MPAVAGYKIAGRHEVTQTRIGGLLDMTSFTHVLADRFQALSELSIMAGTGYIQHCFTAFRPHFLENPSPYSLHHE
jgi:hypothetical protein